MTRPSDKRIGDVAEEALIISRDGAHLIRPLMQTCTCIFWSTNKSQAPGIQSFLKIQLPITQWVGSKTLTAGGPLLRRKAILWPSYECATARRWQSVDTQLHALISPSISVSFIHTIIPGISRTVRSIFPVRTFTACRLLLQTSKAQQQRGICKVNICILRIWCCFIGKRCMSCVLFCYLWLLKWRMWAAYFMKKQNNLKIHS